MRRCLKREEASILINGQRHIQLIPNNEVSPSHSYFHTQNRHCCYPNAVQVVSNDDHILAKLARNFISRNEIEHARHVFDKMSNPKSIVLCNMMIRAYAWTGPFHQAIHLYLHMLQLGVTPNKFTFPFVLKACSSLQAIQVGRLIHSHAYILGLAMDVYVSTALLNMYAKCENLLNAQTLFDSMSLRDIVAWNAMIAGFSLHAFYSETIKLVVQMQQEAGISPNSSTVVSILPTIGQAKALREGKAIHAYSENI